MQGIFNHQRKQIPDVLAHIGMIDCNSIETLIVANHGVQIIEAATPANKGQYQRIVE